MNSLRLEKRYRHSGHDIGDEDAPLETGLGCAVAWSKPDGFLGRDALLRERECGIAGDRIPAEVSLAGFYDPTGLRVRDLPLTGSEAATP